MVNPLITGSGFKSTATNANTNASGAANNQRKSTLDMASFLNLLTAQLSNQDPLDPMNDRDFFAQMAQLGTVQGIDTLNQSMSVTQANSLLGKHVTALRPDSNGQSNDTLVDGTVTGMITQNGTKYLQVTEANGGVVQLTNDAIQSITDATASGINGMLTAANAADLIGKTVTAPHPTLTGETVTAPITAVTFDKGQVLLTVKDRLGNNVQVNLTTVTKFSQ